MTSPGALQTLDMTVAGCVEEAPRAAPPAAPAIGACYVVDLTPTAEWTGKPQCIAAFTSGGWRFMAPQEGMQFYVRATGTWAAYRAGAWELGTVRGASLVLGGEQVVGSRSAAIASPAGGALVDTEARAAINQILTSLRQHGLIET